MSRFELKNLGWISVLIAYLLMQSAFLQFQSYPALAQNKSSGPYFVMDMNDGSIIDAHKEYDRWYPASLTKLMTAYVAMKALNDGELHIGSPVRISKYAASMPPSKMGYKIGTMIRVDTSLKILIVKSANDIAVALAEAVAGSTKEFVKRMNQQAQLLGLSATKFANPNGLHSTEQVTSARDMAVLTRRILTDFPQYSHWFSIPAINTGNKVHYSYNLLLERFEGTTGMKTGFICASGYNMVASATRDKRTLIAVVLGEQSQTDRAVTAAKLLDSGFRNPQQLIGNILTTGQQFGAGPVNMRSKLCTEEARKNRYEPAAGAAIIKSAYLSERKKTQEPIRIRVGGIDGTPSEAFAAAYKNIPSIIPVPTKRPDYEKIVLNKKTRQVVNLPLDNIPVPTLRPNQ